MRVWDTATCGWCAKIGGVRALGLLCHEVIQIRWSWTARLKYAIADMCHPVASCFGAHTAPPFEFEPNCIPARPTAPRAIIVRCARMLRHNNEVSLSFCCKHWFQAASAAARFAWQRAPYGQRHACGAIPFNRGALFSFRGFGIRGY